MDKSQAPTIDYTHVHSRCYADYCLEFQRKQESIYGKSWLRRGDRVSFANLNRKLERLDKLVAFYKHDLFAAMLADTRVADALLDSTVYLLMHIGERVDHLSSYVETVCFQNAKIQLSYGAAWELMNGVGAYADITRKIDALQIYAKSIDFELLKHIRTEKGSERVRDLLGYLLLAAGRFYCHTPSHWPLGYDKIATEETISLHAQSLSEYLTTH